MGFEDFFEEKQRIHKYYSTQDYHDDNRFPVYQRHSYREQVARQKWLAILDRIRKNRQLKLLVAVAVIVLLILAVVLIMVLLPFILKLFDYIGHYGLQGISDAITGFLDKLLKGSGK
jgi:hypothetical protein